LAKISKKLLPTQRVGVVQKINCAGAWRAIQGQFSSVVLCQNGAVIFPMGVDFEFLGECISRGMPALIWHIID
jgi:hypothetical protein